MGAPIYEEGKKINWKDGMKALWYTLKSRYLDADRNDNQVHFIATLAMVLWVLYAHYLYFGGYLMQMVILLRRVLGI